MTDSNPSLRGAIDLGALNQPDQPRAGGEGGGAPGPGADPFASPIVVVGDDSNFNQLIQRTVSVAAVAVAWTSQQPQSRAALDAVVAAAERKDGRLQVISLDLATNPGIMQALQPQQLPVSLGLIQGQAIPLFPGVPSAEDLDRVLDELLTAAVQQGVAGRVEMAGSEQPEQELPPLHQEAYEAIERDDLDAARAAYEQALAQNPGDEDARLGLAQVQLMARTKGADLQAARQAAADDPRDVDAALLVADLDVLGGHVEDGFVRLIDLVKVTTGEERDRVKAHLLDLFAVVGNQDERVRKGRTSLMSALF